MIRSYDKQYNEILENILKNGYYGENRTGTNTYKIPHMVMKFDLEKEFPILSTKKVAFKTCVKEMLWIYRDQSNDVTKLQKQNVHIWDNWADENNTIGKAYGYQIRKFNQIDKLIDTLKKNPQDRRMIMDMWTIDDLDKMQLQPCCFLTMWDVNDGRLNCMLVQRSGDWMLGIPFDTTQYAVLIHMIAQVTNLRPGIFTHVISNCHIYENQLRGAKTQLNRYRDLLKYDSLYKNAEIYNDYMRIPNSVSDSSCKELFLIYNSQPTLYLNPKVKDFYEFTIDDIHLLNYEHLGTIKMPVSV